jgi:tetratricopeptide (TPR) repeat protein
MRSPLLSGLQTVALLLLPLVSVAQSSDAQPPASVLDSIVDTAQTDTLVAIEIPPQAVLDSSELESHRPFSLGMIVPVDSLVDPLVGLDYSDASDVVFAPVAVDSVLASAMLASANAHMQADELDLARGDYESTLAADPGNLRAHTGLGYLDAWTGRHDAATEHFQHALAIDPHDYDAAKGLAYVAHWSGRNDEAAARFGALAASRPDDVEMAMMHAQTLLAARRSSEARAAYERVLALDPDNVDARNGVTIARNTRPKVELTSWLGVTWFDDDERPRAESRVDIRLVEVAIWPTTTSRLWFQYDNGLTLDNVVLSAGNRTVPAGYVGGFIAYERIHTSRLELGWRALPGTVGQVLIRSEHVVALPNRYSIKGGLWLGLGSDDRTESIVHAGMTIPLTDRFDLNPTFFYSSNGMPNEKEWRILMAGEYRFPSDVRIAAGWAGGQASTGYIGDYRGISDRYVKVSLPVGRANRVHALLRSEYVGETDATTILAVGFTVGLSER